MGRESNWRKPLNTPVPDFPSPLGGEKSSGNIITKKKVRCCYSYGLSSRLHNEDSSFVVSKRLKLVARDLQCLRHE